MLINAEDAILGRLASLVAKKALLGEKVDIVNCEKAVISGSKENAFAKYKQRRDMGEPFHGPFFPRTVEGIVKRAIRGMLPWKKDRGRKAFKLIKCYVNIPKEFQGKEMERIKKDVSFIRGKHVTIGNISKWLGHG